MFAGGRVLVGAEVVLNIPVVAEGRWEAGMVAADTAKQSVVQVPAGGSHNFRRTTDQVLLSFHTWGKRAYLSTFRVP